MLNKKVYHGIVTTYKNRKYRSRLEARWATFFDLCGWKYEYEPIDCQGWIPDFALYGKASAEKSRSTGITYVEVKPVVTFPQEVADKIDRSDCQEEALIVGQTIPLQIDCSYEQNLGVGWLREQMAEDKWEWDSAVFGIWSCSAKLGFCHGYGTFFDRISGGYDGGSYGDGGYSESAIQAIVKKNWAEAGNRVQWMRT